MGMTTMGVKLDDATRERIKTAATRIDRTPHWLIKQAIFNYLERLESDEGLPELTGGPMRRPDGLVARRPDDWTGPHRFDDPMLSNYRWVAMLHPFELADGVERDEDRACRLYQEAAAGDYAPALCNLGVCYESGQGVEKNLEKAVELYRRAAEQGSDLARCRLGRLYERGTGVRRDLRQAADLYEKGKQANVPGAGAALARVRSALASPPAVAAEGKKNPLRRLLDRLKGKS